MRRIQMFEDYNPWNTKPQAVAPTNPKIDSTPDLDDDFEEICWDSKSYDGEWCLSGPERTKDDAMEIAGEMKAAESGSPAEVDRLLPIDAFITVYAQKLNPHGWTIDFTPNDLDWTTTPGQHVNEAEKSLPSMPNFLKDAGAKEVHFQMGGPRYPNQPPNCWEISAKLPRTDEILTIKFWPNGNLDFLTKNTGHRYTQFGGKWEANPSSKFQFGPKLLKGVKVILTEAFGEGNFLPM